MKGTDVITEQMIERGVAVFRVVSQHRTSSRGSEKWDEYDRQAVRQILEAARGDAGEEDGT